MPGGAPAVEEGAGSFAVGCGGLPLCGASAFPGTRRLRTGPRGLPGGRYRVAGPGGSPLCAPPIRCVPACSPFPPRPAVCPLPHPLSAPIPPGHPAPPGPDPLCAPLPGPGPLCSPVYHPPPLASRSRPSLFPSVPVPSRSVSLLRRSAFRGSARRWRAVRSPLGSWCGGLGAPVAAARIPVGAVRVKWDTGGTLSDSRCARMDSANCSRAALL